MPIRGRKVRRTSTSEESLPGDGEGNARIKQFKVLAEFSHAPYIQFEVNATLVSRPVVQFPAYARFVDRHAKKFKVKTAFIDRSGSTRTIGAFKVFAAFGGDTGYPTGPRITGHRSLVVGQALRTHREVIPSED